MQVLGYQPFEVLLDHMQRAKCFIFASEEDFGIAPLEAQACGTPVLAYERGGASETVVDGVTGLHFREQTAEAICGIVRRFEQEAGRFDPHRIRAHAEKFSTKVFRARFRRYVDGKWREHRQQVQPEHAGTVTQDWRS